MNADNLFDFRFISLINIKLGAKNVGLGYFFTTLNAGLTFRLSHAGVSVEFPISIFNWATPGKKLHHVASLITLVPTAVLCYFGTKLTAVLLTKLLSRFDYVKKILDKTKEAVKKVRAENESIIAVLKPLAVLKQSREEEKGTNGLLIEYAFIGRPEKINEIYNEDNYGEFDLAAAQREAADFENELAEVTVPVSYAIEEVESEKMSSLFFYMENKEEIIGVTNPLFKETDQATIIIKYRSMGTVCYAVKQFSALFQIPY